MDLYVHHFYNDFKVDIEDCVLCWNSHLLTNNTVADPIKLDFFASEEFLRFSLLS
jgi:hypothetical protein